MEWKHIRDLHSKLSTMATHSKGLSLVPLKSGHINLTSCSKVRVDLVLKHEIVSIVMQLYDNISCSVGYHSYCQL